jgi:hypothetical protein
MPRRCPLQESNLPQLIKSQKLLFRPPTIAVLISAGAPDRAARKERST